MQAQPGFCSPHQVFCSVRGSAGVSSAFRSLTLSVSVLPRCLLGFHPIVPQKHTPNVSLVPTKCSCLLQCTSFDLLYWLFGPGQRPLRCEAHLIGFNVNLNVQIKSYWNYRIWTHCIISALQIPISVCNDVMMKFIGVKSLKTIQ